MLDNSQKKMHDMGVHKGILNRAVPWWMAGVLVFGGVGLAVTSSHDAIAAKIRKKPPVRPLPRGIDSLPPEDLDVEPSPDAAVDATRSKSKSVMTQRAGQPASTDLDKPTPTESPFVAGQPRGLRCLYGQRTQEGRIECLSPEQLQPPVHLIIDTSVMAEKLGMLDKTSAPRLPYDLSESDAGADDLDDSPYEVRVARLSFENGVVGGIRKRFKDEKEKLEQCVERAGGLPTESARLKLLFFVRTSGRPSGLIVASARNVPKPIVRCVKKIVLKQRFARPSRSPVGVKLLFELKEREQPER